MSVSMVPERLGDLAQSGSVLLEVAQIRQTIVAWRDPGAHARDASALERLGTIRQAAQAILERRLCAAEVDGKAGRSPHQFFGRQVRAELGKLILGERLQVPSIRRD